MISDDVNGPLTNTIIDPTFPLNGGGNCVYPTTTHVLDPNLNNLLPFFRNTNWSRSINVSSSDGVISSSLGFLF